MVTALSFVVTVLFLFVSSGFNTDYCLLVVSGNGVEQCSGIASRLPLPLSWVVLFGVYVYSVYLGTQQGREH